MKQIVESLEAEFDSLYADWLEVLQDVDFEPAPATRKPSGTSAVELLVRSAARVEQCFGGLTARLWDDPYEWTLPESFSSNEAVRAYLDEVDQTRKRGFALFSSDKDLTRQIAAPEELKQVYVVVMRALLAATSDLTLARDRL